MKKVSIKKMKIANFKGLRDFTIEPNGESINIHGDNGTGKTSIFDAFTWCLFGKDSEDRKSFNVKTLAADGSRIDKTEASVFLELDVNGMTTTFERTLREKWVKKKGSDVAEFEGTENVCVMNGVPMGVGDFSKQVAAIIDEDNFKMLTNPFYFLSEVPWKTRREIIFRICELPSDVQLATGRFAALGEVIASGRALDMYAKELAASRLKLKKEIDLMPARIDEALRAVAKDAGQLSIEQLRAQQKAAQNEMDSITATINDERKQFDAILDEERELKTKRVQLLHTVQSLRNALSMQQQEERNEALRMVSDLQYQKQSVETKIKAMKTDIALDIKAIEFANRQVELFKKELASLREDFARINAETFSMPEGADCCPTCKRQLDDAQSRIEELRAAFNDDKIKRLQALNSEGAGLKNKEITYEDSVKEKTDAINYVKSELAKAEQSFQEIEQQIREVVIPEITEPTDTEEINDLLQQIKGVDEQLAKGPQPFDATKYNSRIEFLKAEIAADAQRIATLENNARQEVRVDELKKEERELAIKIAEIENNQMLVDDFTSHKVASVEASIARIFGEVKFRMFTQQLNGGLDETCEAVVAGVPYQDLNNAAKINAGLICINVLANSIDVNAPIFIDNAESVTRFVSTDAQIIKLIVDATAEKLIVK
jgi:exonuclease SbcC